MNAKKRKITYKNVLAALFSVIIFFFFITIFERFVRSSILKQDIFGVTAAEQGYTNYSSVYDPQFDWQKLYPFKNKNEIETNI